MGIISKIIPQQDPNQLGGKPVKITKFKDGDVLVYDSVSKQWKAGTVTVDITTKADKTNVLEKNNTTAFTPDADYEPATKKYVDDNGGGLTQAQILARTLGC